MKIHIVQKGDTLWELAKKYGVDFEELKKMNPQLSSPDMIMPGMKIKIPSTSKPVKKEHHVQKEEKKPMAKQPYKDISPKPKPVVKEDDMEKPKDIKPKMPMQPIMQMPTMEQEMTNYTTINFPHMPYPKPMEKPKEQEKMPSAEQPYPMMPDHMPMPHHMPMVPVYCCYYHPCYPPMHHAMPMEQMPMHHVQPLKMPDYDCGCGGPAPMQYPASHQPMMEPMQYPASYQPMMEPMESSMEMPTKPMYNPYMNDCNDYQSHMPSHPMGMQAPYPPQTPPQSHPQFSHKPYPMPPGYGPNHMQPRQGDEEEQNEE